MNMPKDILRISSMTTTDIPEAAKLEQVVINGYWTIDGIKDHFKSIATGALVGKIRDRVSGYLLYKKHRNYIKIIAAGYPINYQDTLLRPLIERLKTRLTGNRTAILITFLDNDLEMLDVLRNQGFQHQERASKDVPEDSSVFGFREGVKPGFDVFEDDVTKSTA